MKGKIKWIVCGMHWRHMTPEDVERLGGEENLTVEVSQKSCHMCTADRIQAFERKRTEGDFEIVKRLLKQYHDPRFFNDAYAQDSLQAFEEWIEKGGHR